MAVDTYFAKKVIPSLKKAIKEVEPMLHDLRDNFGLKDDIYYNLLISLTEAVNNAIIHGNKCDPDKNVTIEIHSDGTLYQLIISDEGDGFNPDAVADPRNPENILKSNGRGIFLIKALSTESSFVHSSEGTTVTIQFKCKN